MNRIDASHLYSGNADFIEHLYENFLQNPQSVEPEWREYFEQMQQSEGAKDVAHGPVRQAFLQAAKSKAAPRSTAMPAQNSVSHQKQVSVLQLINAHRFRGHNQASLDPLEQHERPHVPELELDYHGLGEQDMDTVFNTGSLVGPDEATLREILDTIRTTYCRNIGAEYMHINETEQKRWIQQYLESCRSTPSFSIEKRKHILGRVIAANALEEYLHTRYVGQKRFSLEGGECLIPLLDELVQVSGDLDMREMVIGMAHRGRLNVLVNIIGKMPHELFGEFEGKPGETTSSGDVKYHLGYSSDIGTKNGSIHLTLSFNPSHLEIIDPVVEGSVRARQDRRKDKARE